jgi:exopolyphosphatase/pppGpp-phosphohydrolase
MRVAAIDLGTNSTRLLVADVGGAHHDVRLAEIARRLEITRVHPVPGEDRMAP